ncbi:MAG: DUF5522 domain-containing protein [Bacteroidia bacterium]|nr:DUF5522 domain-containing protein [Bacteroidia bacterium]
METTNYSATKLIPGEDYYISEQGFFVFTEAYHLKRGYCCGNGCKHCPYGNANKKPTKKMAPPR